MLFVILMTLAAGAQMAHAAKGGRSDFYQKYMSRPSEELIRIGKDYRLRKNKPDSALLFFTIVAGRYTPNMSAEEKREVVEALNMNYFIYSFRRLPRPTAGSSTSCQTRSATAAAAHWHLWRPRRCNDSCTTSTKDWPSWRRRRNSMSNTRLATACRASIRPTPSSMRTWGARPTTTAAWYRYYQINDSLKAYSLPSNVFNMGLNEKVIELNQEMDGMKERQTQHRIWLIVAVLTTFFFVIILLVVMRENRELRRRNLALYHRSLEVLKSDEMAGKQRKTVSAPAVEENNAATASSKYHHSTLSDADKDRIAQLVQQVMEQTEVIIQPDFTVEKLAQNISTGQKYVSQVINETFECNFNTLLGRYRIREACRRFNDPQRYGSYTIESIARDLGFKSRSNFATTFKKHTGLNPSEYLRLAKEKNGL